jgi:hypothetical protein
MYIGMESNIYTTEPLRPRGDQASAESTADAVEALTRIQTEYCADRS